MRPSRWRLAALTIVVLGGAALRFWGLPGKPAWLDEVITMLVIGGRGPEAIPIGAAIPLSAVSEWFSSSTTATTSTTGAVIGLLPSPDVQHTPPPLFYVIAHTVLASRLAGALTLTTTVRSIAAVFSLISVLALYACARDLFGDRAAMLAAVLSAFSPYGVMLSQEAR